MYIAFQDRNKKRRLSIEQDHDHILSLGLNIIQIWCYAALW